MKIILTIALSFFALTILAQDKYYTKGLVNGFAWTAPPSASKLAYSKSESLSEILYYKKYKTSLQKELSFPLDCEADVEELYKTNDSSTIELEIIVKMIDEFYVAQENLIIPVLGAYCYSVKKLVGTSAENLEIYMIKLLEYSKK